MKFSGVVTEFPEGGIDPDTVEAYFHETLELFGADKVMFGTDWPPSRRTRWFASGCRG